MEEKAQVVDAHMSMTVKAAQDGYKTMSMSEGQRSSTGKGLESITC